MKSTLLKAFPLMLALSTALQAGTELPEKLWSLNPNRISPIWVSARIALDHGSLRPGTMADHEASVLRKQLRQPPLSSSSIRTEVLNGPCDVTFGALFDDTSMPSSRTLDDVHRYASKQSLVQGVVVASEVGFYAGTPFTLVQVRVTRANKSRNMPFAYLLIPKGVLTVEGQKVCTSDPRYGEVPANGDTVLFVAGPPLDVDGTLFRIPSEHLFVWHANALLAPGRLHASEIRGASLKHLWDLLEDPRPIGPSNEVRQ